MHLQNIMSSKSSVEFDFPKCQVEHKERGAFGNFGDLRPHGQALMQYDNVDGAPVVEYECPVLFQSSVLL